jgi:chaperonin GroES
MSEATFSSGSEGLPDRMILSTQFGQYEWANYDGVNRSGLQPLCDKVLVLCDQPSPQTTGGIIIPDDAKEKVGFAAITGVLVAIGPQAFAYDSRRLVYWEGERPKAGDRVYFQKYAGFEYYGRDGLMYRVMEDRQIAALEIPIPETAEHV